MRAVRSLSLVFFLTTTTTGAAQWGAPWTWGQLRQRFEQNNPRLQAQLNIGESKAEEITAYLHPNPGLTLSTDGTQLAPYHRVWEPFVGTEGLAALSYLPERDHKCEFRLKSAQEGTAIATSTQADLERTLLFTLRSAFVGMLEAKAVLQ